MHLSGVKLNTNKLTYLFNADELIYWASIVNPEVKMATLNGTERVTLFNESKADYTGITLYNNCLYISDQSRRSVPYCISTCRRCP